MSYHNTDFQKCGRESGIARRKKRLETLLKLIKDKQIGLDEALWLAYRLGKRSAYNGRKYARKHKV